MDENELTLRLDGGAKYADFFVHNDPVYGSRLFVRDGETYKEQTNKAIEPVRCLNDRKYDVRESTSFVEYVKTYGNPAEGIVFYIEKGVTMFFDEKNRVERVHLPFGYSLELQAFLGAEGVKRTHAQKDFVKTIETFPDVVKGIDAVLPHLKLLTMSKQIVFESNIDPDNYTFVYREKGGDQSVNIPKQLTLIMPYIEGSEVKVEIVADLECEMPTGEGQKPTFILTDPRQKRTLKDVLKREIEVIKASLAGWMFVQGGEAQR